MPRRFGSPHSRLDGGVRQVGAIARIEADRGRCRWCRTSPRYAGGAHGVARPWRSHQVAGTERPRFAAIYCADAARCSRFGARDLQGNVECYGPILNAHANHILDVSVVPAGLPPHIEAEALSIARAILEEFDVVGVLCIEFFLTRSGQLQVNELAPRPRNSGHLTIDAHVTCQFEQQVRAVCGLPLGSPELIRPAAMANLLGDIWNDGLPQWLQLLAYPDVKLHLYGKQSPRPGRKMGHITVQADRASDAEKIIRQTRDSISNGPLNV